MIVGNVLTLALTPGTVRYKAIYGTITQKSFATPASVFSRATSASVRKTRNAPNVPYTWAEQESQFETILAEWKAMTISGGSGGDNTQRAIIIYQASNNNTTNEYELNSSIQAGFSTWNTSSVAGEKVFQVQIEIDLEQMDMLIYFATFTGSLPDTTMEDVRNNGVDHVSGYSWYDLATPLVMGDRLLVGIVPKSLTITDPGTEFWAKVFFAGNTNPTYDWVRYYTEPV